MAPFEAAFQGRRGASMGNPEPPVASPLSDLPAGNAGRSVVLPAHLPEDLRRSSGSGAAVRHEPEQSQPVVLLPALLAALRGLGDAPPAPSRLWRTGWLSRRGRSRRWRSLALPGEAPPLYGTFDVKRFFNSAFPYCLSLCSIEGTIPPFSNRAPSVKGLFLFLRNSLIWKATATPCPSFRWWNGGRVGRRGQARSRRRRWPGGPGLRAPAHPIIIVLGMGCCGRGWPKSSPPGAWFSPRSEISAATWLQGGADMSRTRSSRGRAATEGAGSSSPVPAGTGFR